MAIDREKLEALTKLGIARREKLATEDFRVYLDGLASWSSATVREACRRLSESLPGEYDPRFPILATVIETCRTVAREQALRNDQKRLNAPDFVPVDPEKVQAFLAQIRAAIGRHQMPKVDTSARKADE